MTQSQQEDLFPDLEAFARTAYLNLAVAALKRDLTDYEVCLLHEASHLCTQLVQSKTTYNGRVI
jgi:hypothetical protein